MLVLVLTLLLLPPAILAADEAGVTPSIIEAILGAALFGVPLAGLVEIVKRTIKKLFKVTVDKPWLGYVASGVVIAILDYVVLSGAKIFNVPNFLTAFAIAWAVANGFYKVTVKAPVEKMAAALAAAKDEKN